MIVIFGGKKFKIVILDFCKINTHMVFVCLIYTKYRHEHKGTKARTRKLIHFNCFSLSFKLCNGSMGFESTFFLFISIFANEK